MHNVLTKREREDEREREREREGGRPPTGNEKKTDQ